MWYWEAVRALIHDPLWKVFRLLGCALEGGRGNLTSSSPFASLAMTWKFVCCRALSSWWGLTSGPSDGASWLWIAIFKTRVDINAFFCKLISQASFSPCSWILDSGMRYPWGTHPAHFYVYFWYKIYLDHLVAQAGLKLGILCLSLLSSWLREEKPTIKEGSWSPAGNFLHRLVEKHLC